MGRWLSWAHVQLHGTPGMPKGLRGRLLLITLTASLPLACLQQQKQNQRPRSAGGEDEERPEEEHAERDEKVGLACRLAGPWA